MSSIKTADTLTNRSVEELEKLLAKSEKEKAAIQKDLEAMQKAADEKAAQLEAMKRASAMPSPATQNQDELKKRVSIRLPANSGKEPLFVRFNDETFIIKRGVEVSIPYYVWLHMQECNQADDAVLLKLNELEAKFQTDSAAYGLRK